MVRFNDLAEINGLAGKRNTLQKEIKASIGYVNTRKLVQQKQQVEQRMMDLGVVLDG